MDLEHVFQLSPKRVLQWTRNLSRILHGEITLEQLELHNANTFACILFNEMLWISDEFVNFTSNDRVCREHSTSDLWNTGRLAPGSYRILQRSMSIPQASYDVEELKDALRKPVQPLTTDLDASGNRWTTSPTHIVVPEPYFSLEELKDDMFMIMQLKNSRWQYVLFLRSENNDSEQYITTKNYAEHAMKFPALFNSNCVRIGVTEMTAEQAAEQWADLDFDPQSMANFENQNVYAIVYEFIGGGAWAHLEHNLALQYNTSQFGKQQLKLPQALLTNRPPIPHQIRVTSSDLPALPNALPEADIDMIGEDGVLESVRSRYNRRTFHNDRRVPELNQMSAQRVDNILTRIGRDAPAGSALARVFGDNNMRGLVTQPNYYGTDRSSMYQRLSHQDWRTWNGIYQYANNMSSEQRQLINPDTPSQYDFTSEARHLWTNFWQTLVRCVRQALPVSEECIQLSTFMSSNASPLLPRVFNTKMLKAVLFEQEEELLIPFDMDINLNVSDEVNRNDNVNDQMMVRFVQETDEFDMIQIFVSLNRESNDNDLAVLQQIMKREFPTLMCDEKIGTSLIFHRDFQEGWTSTSLRVGIVKSKYFQNLSVFKDEPLLRRIHAKLDPSEFDWEFSSMSSLDAS